MHLHDGRVQFDGLNLDAHDLLALQLRKYPIQDAILEPAVHAGIDGVPVSETLGQPTPLAPLLGHVQNRVQYRKVRHAHVATLTRQTGLNATVLRFRDLHKQRISRKPQIVLTRPNMNLPSVYHRFVLLFVVSLFFWWRTLVATFSLALQNRAYTHILLIIPISIALIFSEWRSRKAQPEPDFRTGLALLVLAILIGFIGGRWRGPTSLPAGVQLSLDMLAVVTWWIGSFVCCFGTRIFRMSVFPLCFLLWLVPLPEFALNHIVNFLQQGSAYAAHLFFAIAGVPVTQDGVRLTIPGLTLEVAEECSSIRSSLMLLVTTMVLAHLLLRSAWGKGVVILAAIPLSIAKNGVRIFTLSMLTVYVDPGFMHGGLHHQGGIVFFLVFLAGLFVLIWLVRRAERKLMVQPAVEKLRTPIAVAKATPDNCL